MPSSGATTKPMLDSDREREPADLDFVSMMSRSAAQHLLGSSRPARMTPNSSPPRRATASWGRMWSARRCGQLR